MIFSPLLPHFSNPVLLHIRASYLMTMIYNYKSSAELCQAHIIFIYFLLIEITAIHLWTRSSFTIICIVSVIYDGEEGPHFMKCLFRSLWQYGTAESLYVAVLAKFTLKGSDSVTLLLCSEFTGNILWFLVF